MTSKKALPNRQVSQASFKTSILIASSFALLVTINIIAQNSDQYRKN